MLASHAPSLKLDMVVADERSVVDRERLGSVASSFGADLLVADVAADDGSPRHDAAKLAHAYAEFLGEA